jgi:hypothetical protein
LSVAATLALALGAPLFPSLAGAKSVVPAKLKLPAERTSAVGNFFTLEAYDPPTAKSAVANFEVKLCTSSHTPNPTYADPALFTLSVTGSGSVGESASTKRPAYAYRQMKPLQCTEGWLGFRVPKGKSPGTLEYSYLATISWKVG